MTQKSYRLITLALLITVFSLSCNLLAPNSSPRPAAVTPIATHATIAIQLPEAITNEEAVLTNLYAQIRYSVVSIVVYANANGQLEAVGQGSGFVYDTSGNIVTNAHVVHGASQVEVVFADNTILRAEIIGEDLYADLAVVKVDSLPPDAAPLPLGDMNEVAVGQTVVAIGNPFGLGGTMTRGIISALGRSIPALNPSYSIPQSIQTDAPINPGNSGGPLLNLKGEVIGVNAQIETGGQSDTNSGIGFAIPVSIVQRVVPDLIQYHKHAWGWLGIQDGGDVTPALVEAMNLPVTNGAYIGKVLQNGPAAKARLQGATDTQVVNGHTVLIGGDLIIAIDGQPVTTFEDVLLYIVLNTTPGQEVNLTIIRDGKQMDIKLILEERPQATEYQLP